MNKVLRSYKVESIKDLYEIANNEAPNSIKIDGFKNIYFNIIENDDGTEELVITRKSLLEEQILNEKNKSLWLIAKEPFDCYVEYNGLWHDDYFYFRSIKVGTIFECHPNENFLYVGNNSKIRIKDIMKHCETINGSENFNKFLFEQFEKVRNKMNFYSFEHEYIVYKR